MHQNKSIWTADALPCSGRDGRVDVRNYVSEYMIEEIRKDVGYREMPLLKKKSYLEKYDSIMKIKDVMHALL